MKMKSLTVKEQKKKNLKVFKFANRRLDSFDGFYINVTEVLHGLEAVLALDSPRNSVVNCKTLGGVLRVIFGSLATQAIEAI